MYTDFLVFSRTVVIIQKLTTTMSCSILLDSVHLLLVNDKSIIQTLTFSWWQEFRLGSFGL